MKQLSVIAVLVWLAAAVDMRAELAYYFDGQGRRVYINANAQPSPQASQTTRSGHRYSVLVKRDPFTNRLVRVPPPPDPLDREKSAPAPARSSTLSPSSPAAETSSPPAGFRRSFQRLPERTPVPAVESVIEKTAERHSLDANLVRAIIQVESNFDPLAVSYKGARGLMQLIPGTARRFGVTDLFNPVENVEGGVRYLKYLLGLFDGNLQLSLAAYNAGEKAVQRHGGVPPYAETRQYVQKIAALYRNGLTLAPQPERTRWGIVKYVDENGRTHFSNTDMP